MDKDALGSCFGK